MNAFINTAHKTAQHDLALCGNGNLSYRKNKHHMLISANDSWISDITEDQRASCRIKDGVCINDKKMQDNVIKINRILTLLSCSITPSYDS